MWHNRRPKGYEGGHKESSRKCFLIEGRFDFWFHWQNMERDFRKPWGDWEGQDPLPFNQTFLKFMQITSKKIHSPDLPVPKLMVTFTLWKVDPVLKQISCRHCREKKKSLGKERVVALQFSPVQKFLFMAWEQRSRYGKRRQAGCRNPRHWRIVLGSVGLTTTLGMTRRNGWTAWSPWEKVRAWCGMEESQRKNKTKRMDDYRDAHLGWFWLEYFFHMMVAGMDPENSFFSLTKKKKKR